MRTMLFLTGKQKFSREDKDFESLESILGAFTEDMKKSKERTTGSQSKEELPVTDVVNAKPKELVLLQNSHIQIDGMRLGCFIFYILNIVLVEAIKSKSDRCHFCAMLRATIRYCYFKKHGTKVFQLLSVDDQKAVFQHRAILADQPKNVDVDHQDLNKMPMQCPLPIAQMHMPGLLVQQDFEKLQVAMVLHQTYTAHQVKPDQISFSIYPSGCYTLQPVRKKAMKLIPLGVVTLQDQERCQAESGHPSFWQGMGHQPLITPVSLLPTGALPHAISHPPSPLVASTSLLPTGALPKLFPSVSPPCTLLSLPSRSFPTELSPSYFPPLRPPSCRFRIAPSQRSSPQAISHGFPSVHPVVTSVLSLLPNGTFSPCYFYFPRFPLRPPSRHSRIVPSHRSSPQAIHGFPSVPCRHSRVAPSHRSSPQAISHVSLPSTLSSLPYCSFSHRSSPQAISHGFPPVHPLVAPVSLLPTGALPKLFPTVSLPSTLSSLPYRSFPPDRIAPSHRSSPQAISHGFPSVHPVVTPVSLLPTGALPKLFPTVSLPSTLSSFPYRSFTPELSPSYFPRFPLRPPIISYNRCFHPFPPNGALPKLFPTVSLPSTLSSLPYRSFPPGLSPSYSPQFPFRPPSRHSRIAPSHRSSFHAISHCFLSVHPIVASIRSLPTELSPSYFPRFPLRPPSRQIRIAPSRQM